jgi:hypothetical protein
VGKVLYLIVALSLLGTARCYNADLASSLSTVPIVGPMISPPPVAPAYVAAIGTPAPATLPEIDFKKWFPTDAAADQFDPVMWAAIRDLLSTMRTQAGWTEACKKVSAAAGADRAAAKNLGPLACSADPSVTNVQGFATAILAVQAEVALWVKGAPGSSIGAIQGRQGELRLLCSADSLRRQGGLDGPFAQACTKALDAAYLSGDGKATFTALSAAYTLVAAEIAKRDPKIAPEPAFFGAAPEKK